MVGSSGCHCCCGTVGVVLIFISMLSAPAVAFLDSFSSVPHALLPYYHGLQHHPSCRCGLSQEQRSHNFNNNRRLVLLLLEQSSVGLLPNEGGESQSIEATTVTPPPTLVPVVIRPPCFYRAPPNNWWKPRLELSDLFIGQELTNAVVVQTLLQGKTGPKVFCEVGVGRCRSSTTKRPQPPKWKMVYAMLRLGPPGGKASVAAKRAARLVSKGRGPGATGFSVFVHKIRLDNDQLEVCLEQEDALQLSLRRRGREQAAEPKLVSVSSLSVGQQLTGQVIRLESYGVLVHVGANRPGLLHISSILRHYAKQQRQQRQNNKPWIELKNNPSWHREVGLFLGARIPLKVKSNHQKRLLLEFSTSSSTDAAVPTIATTPAAAAGTTTGDSMGREQPLPSREVQRTSSVIGKERGSTGASSTATTTTTMTTNNDPTIQNVQSSTPTRSIGLVTNNVASSSSSSDNSSVQSSSSSSASLLNYLSPEEEAEWAAFAASSTVSSFSTSSSPPSMSNTKNNSETSLYSPEEYKDNGDDMTNNDDDDEETYDAYDEDRDIEDALGLGTY